MEKDLAQFELTERIIGAFFKVYNSLGYGFLEKVYENALLLTLRKMGLNAESQVPINVFYEGKVVGEYFADILVNECVILEIKAVERLTDAHHAQLINYLRATGVTVGILFNFGPEAQFSRRAFTHQPKRGQAGASKISNPRGSI